MVVLFFAVGKNQYTFTTREFADYLKKGVLANSDQKKIIGLEVFLKIIIKIAWYNERPNNEFSRFSAQNK
jgi:hypothetical protein